MHLSKTEKTRPRYSRCHSRVRVVASPPYKVEQFVAGVQKALCMQRLKVDGLEAIHESLAQLCAQEVDRARLHRCRIPCKLACPVEAYVTSLDPPMRVLVVLDRRIGFPRRRN